MLQALELRVPPLLLMLLVAAAMWGVAGATLRLGELPAASMAFAAVLAAAGAGACIAGVASFRQAGTTVDPTRPDAASSLVQSGVYRVTRNPMYLGFTLVLLAWAVALSSVAALPFPLLYAAWIQRFQIVPEERILTAQFGQAFADYCQRVRRWL